MFKPIKHIFLTKLIVTLLILITIFINIPVLSLAKEEGEEEIDITSRIALI